MKIQHISKDPRWQAAQAKLQELRQQLAEATEAAAKLRNSNYSDYRLTLEDEAQSLLNGKAIRETSGSVEVAALARRCEILREAIRIQELEVARVRNEVSREICEAIRPEYEILAHAVVDAVKVLRDAVGSEFRLRSEMEAADLAFASTIPLCVYPMGEYCHDFMARVDSFLSQAATNGYE
jgi:ketopantoate reductase